MLTIRLDQDLCEANALCVRHAPRVFQLNAQGTVDILIEHPDESMRAEVQAAIDYCPRAALSLEET